MDRVFSLAKASDTSDKFYLGIRGAIAEAQLVLSEDIPSRQQKAQPCPNGWHVSRLPNVNAAETGVSLRMSSVHEGSHGDLHNGMPEMLHQYDGSATDQGYRVLLDAPKRGRLDSAWRQQKSMRQNGLTRG